MCAVFLGPLAVVSIITDIQIKRLEKEDRKLAKMEQYGLSESDLTMNVRGCDR